MINIKKSFRNYINIYFAKIVGEFKAAQIISSFI